MYKQINNTSFHEETIKKMTLKEFEKTYSGVLKGQDVKEVFEKITGKKAEKKKDDDNLG
jgi:hypothetical protein